MVLPPPAGPYLRALRSASNPSSAGSSLFIWSIIEKKTRKTLEMFPKVHAKIVVFLVFFPEVVFPSQIFLLSAPVAAHEKTTSSSRLLNTKKNMVKRHETQAKVDWWLGLVVWYFPDLVFPMKNGFSQERC